MGHNSDDDALQNATTSSDSSINQVAFSATETTFEKIFGLVIGIAFLITAIVAARRMAFSRKQQQQQQQQRSTTTESGGGGARSVASASTSSSSGGAEATVVFAFYSLICVTGILRAIWFLVPGSVWQPSGYTPRAIYAFDSEHYKHWAITAVSEIILTCGSLTLFSIFILILVYWADILKKYFHPGSKRVLPMNAFFYFVSTLVLLEIINILLFLLKLYTTEGMILFNAALLAVVSIVCVVKITLFSRQFRTVLKTLGAINQVSTDSQVQRILWITITGNLFFFTRFLLETIFAVCILYYYHETGTVAKPFSHMFWDIYIFLIYWSELTILALMLYILQTRFAQQQAAGSGGSVSSARTTTTAGSTTRPGVGGGYTKVPDAPTNV